MGHANGYPEESGIYDDLQERISKSVVPLANALFLNPELYVNAFGL